MVLNELNTVNWLVFIEDSSYLDLKRVTLVWLSLLFLLVLVARKLIGWTDWTETVLPDPIGYSTHLSDGYLDETAQRNSCNKPDYISKDSMWIVLDLLCPRHL